MDDSGEKQGGLVILTGEFEGLFAHVLGDGGVQCQGDAQILRERAKEISKGTLMSFTSIADSTDQSIVLDNPENHSRPTTRPLYVVVSTVFPHDILLIHIVVSQSLQKMGLGISNLCVVEIGLLVCPRPFDIILPIGGHNWAQMRRVCLRFMSTPHQVFRATINTLPPVCNKTRLGLMPATFIPSRKFRNNCPFTSASSFAPAQRPVRSFGSV